MKILKKLSLLLLSTIILIGACGCMKLENNYIDRMVNYLNEKYDDDEFEYSSPFGGGAGASYKKILCSSKNYPDEDVCVFLEIDENGNEIIEDNYLSVKYKEQVVELIDQILTESFSTDYLLFYNVNEYGITENSTQYTTFEEYVSEVSSYITFVAVVNSEYNVDREVVESTLEEKLVENGFCCKSAVIYFDAGNGIYDNLTSTKLSGYSNRHEYKECFELNMETNKGYSKTKWR